MKKKYEWSKLFDIFFIINASSDIVCHGFLAKSQNNFADKNKCRLNGPMNPKIFFTFIPNCLRITLPISA